MLKALYQDQNGGALYTSNAVLLPWFFQVVDKLGSICGGALGPRRSHSIGRGGLAHDHGQPEVAFWLGKREYHRSCILT